jgi:hypothetical protein
VSEEPSTPPPPRTIADLPEDVRAVLLARQAASEAYTEECERRSAWRRFRGVILGALAALAMSPFVGAEGWWFALLMTGVGAVLAFTVVRRECEALGGGVIFGGGLVLFTLIATFSGLTRPLGAPHTTIGLRDSLFFAWAILCGTGGLIGYLAEQDRSLHVG